MSKEMKRKQRCKHEWEYFDEWYCPNGYEYKHVGE